MGSTFFTTMQYTNCSSLLCPPVHGRCVMLSRYSTSHGCFAGRLIIGYEGGYCRARLGAVFPIGHNYAGLTILSCKASVHYPSTSVCMSWYPRQLITIISDLLPSKKQIIGIWGNQPNRWHQQQQLYVCMGLCCFFSKLFQ